MPVYRGSDGFDDALSDTVVLGKRTDLLLVFLCQPERGEQILLFVDMIGFYDRREDWEAVLRVEGGIEVVAVDTRHLLYNC